MVSKGPDQHVHPQSNQGLHYLLRESLDTTECMNVQRPGIRIILKEKSWNPYTPPFKNTRPEQIRLNLHRFGNLKKRKKKSWNLPKSWSFLSLKGPDDTLCRVRKLTGSDRIWPNHQTGLTLILPVFSLVIIISFHVKFYFATDSLSHRYITIIFKINDLRKL